MFKDYIVQECHEKVNEGEQILLFNSNLTSCCNQGFLKGEELCFRSFKFHRSVDNQTSWRECF